jgi:phage shock protein A
MFNLKVRMNAKSLESEARRLQNQVAQERAKAKSALSLGNRFTANVHAQNAVRLEQQVHDLFQYSAAITGMGIDIQKAEVNSQTAQMMKIANRAIENATKNVSLDELAKVRHRMDGLKQQAGAAHKLIVNGDGLKIPQEIPAVGRNRWRMVASVK